MSKPRRIAVRLEMDWPYKRHSAVFVGFQQYAQQRGWYMVVDEYAEDTLARCPESERYDGIIARATEDLAVAATRLNIPIVNVWVSSPVWKQIPCVFHDFVITGRLRAEHLLSRGLRQFATLTNNGDRAQIEDRQAFTELLKEAGCPVTSAQIALNSASSVKEWRQSERTIAAWMDGWKLPIGVFVGSESHGRLVAQACHNRGWRVPDDVAIIAGYNEVTLCEGLRPTLTSVEMGYERIGYEVAHLLERLMDGEPAPTEPIVIPPQGLVVRESTDFFAVDDKVIAASLKFIAEHSSEDIGQEDVARAVAVETRTLQRRFQKVLNRPIHAEIRRVRIERAKRELAQGERSMKEIAQAVGFRDPMRMYEVFRRELGISPSQYRHERREPVR